MTDNVLDLTAEFTEAEAFRTTRYCNLPLLDLTAPTQDQLRQAVAFLAAEVENGVVYLHCKIGYSRSAAAVGGYLIHSNRADGVDDAIAQLRAARPSEYARPVHADADIPR